mmetsp:Transcript_21316/g.45582  ORF Transcript_21316/g.45582 Transcript_21316/m.45582 type:complete len:294 (-) Transcript_21316:254-1135(-)
MLDENSSTLEQILGKVRVWRLRYEDFVDYFGQQHQRLDIVLAGPNRHPQRDQAPRDVEVPQDPPALQQDSEHGFGGLAEDGGESGLDLGLPLRTLLSESGIPIYGLRQVADLGQSCRSPSVNHRVLGSQVPANGWANFDHSLHGEGAAHCRNELDARGSEKCSLGRWMWSLEFWQDMAEEKVLAEAFRASVIQGGASAESQHSVKAGIQAEHCLRLNLRRLVPGGCGLRSREKLACEAREHLVDLLALLPRSSANAPNQLDHSASPGAAVAAVRIERKPLRGAFVEGVEIAMS